MDQQMHSLVVIRKAYKWYKKLFFRFMLQCLLSSHKLYKMKGGNDDFLNFVHDVMTQLFTLSFQTNLKNAPRTALRASLATTTSCPRWHMMDRVGGERQRSVMFVTQAAYGHRKQAHWEPLECPSLPGL